MVRNPNSEQESWWLLRAQSGDGEALNALLQSIQASLYRYILSLVREEALAEVILQEVFMRIYSIVVLGLVALGAHMNRGVLGVLRAFELARA